jgi:hypothetical protein
MIYNAGITSFQENTAPFLESHKPLSAGDKQELLSIATKMRDDIRNVGELMAASIGEELHDPALPMVAFYVPARVPSNPRYKKLISSLLSEPLSVKWKNDPENTNQLCKELTVLAQSEANSNQNVFAMIKTPALVSLFETLQNTLASNCDRLSNTMKRASEVYVEEQFNFDSQNCLQAIDKCVQGLEESAKLGIIAELFAIFGQITNTNDP